MFIKSSNKAGYFMDQFGWKPELPKYVQWKSPTPVFENAIQHGGADTR
jgi:hypothetical protein